ncbi:MAG: 2,3,4,5-tetrahydropyridine-2,6-dicarboxylate N-succinyltransferase [Deltaproteobacteria bacterium]|nr:2,3,4,5-tetrahydropyridine-2,6-dicarboxylate N-succinyltransferase [Deltaproteobacteria bacterium]
MPTPPHALSADQIEADPRAALISAALAGARPLDEEVERAARSAVEDLDLGLLRVASPPEAGDAGEAGEAGGEWRVHAWVKEAILLYFRVSKSAPMDDGVCAYLDKVPPKRRLEGVRVVPPGVARYGSFLEPGVILMPGYVNIGARVGAGSMVDTWATVGSCAQVGAGVHLSGGVGLGGVLEPASARPVIIEDGAFIGSRCVVVEGVRVGRGAVLGAGVVLTASTPIIDARGAVEVIYKGAVPPRAVVVPASRPKAFPAGTYHLPCALIIGERGASTDLKTSLNDALRDLSVAV